jgi:hypothetical protein
MTGRAPLKGLVVAAAVALVTCSAAAAHGGGGALGFRSTVTAIRPAPPAGLSVTVLDYDDRLQLRNESDEALIILGYQGEPYLAFRDGRVYRNTRSPATYLNDDRFGRVALPAQADPKAAPDWQQVSPREEYEWHDHRIHWMSRTLPPKVRAAKDKRQHVFDWTVPAQLGGKPLTIVGSLDYEPPPDKLPKPLIAILGALIVIGGAAVWLRRRRWSAET